MAITCTYCGTHFPKSDKVNARHLSVCAGWQAKKEPPNVEPCLCGHTDTSLTQMKRHRQKCEVWKGRDRGKVQTERLVKTLREAYGTDEIQSLRDVPGTEEKRKATMRDRYGTDYAFDKASALQPKIQAGIEAARPEGETATNPFAWAETKQKIRTTMETRYGASHPMHVPEIKAQVKQTTQERHGGIAMGSPTLRVRIESTNLERYGMRNAGASPEAVESARQTNQTRRGVDWTCQVPEVRAKQLETMVRNYGSHYFASPEGMARVKQAMIERFGVANPMQVPDIARLVLIAAQAGPNRLESDFAAMNPELLYTGRGDHWVWLTSLSKNKNPDFVVPGSDPMRPLVGVTRVVEMQGSYWHSAAFTGKSEAEHEAEVVAAYAAEGVRCLVVWEGEFRRDPVAVRERVLDHLSLENEIQISPCPNVPQ